MENSKAIEQPGLIVEPDTKPKKNILKIIKKFTLILLVSVAVILTVGHFVWKASGSNKWVLDRNQNGVQIYSVKTPGTTLLRFKAIIKLKTSLSGFVALMQDHTACGSYCLSGELLDKKDPQTLYFNYKSGLPSPFKPREKVIMGRYTQDPDTKKLLIEFIATPNKIPRNECCVRVLHKYSTWQVTPLENGEVEIEFTIDEDMGGNLPHYLMNSVMPNYIVNLLPNMQQLLDDKKYQNASYDFLVEPSI